jgi:hypothetical protein
MNDQINSFNLFSLLSFNCGLTLYRLYTASSRERRTLALSKGPIDSACRHREESPGWGSSLGEGQPRLVAHTVFWYACLATLYGTDLNCSSASGFKQILHMNIFCNTVGSAITVYFALKL